MDDGDEYVPQISQLDHSLIDIGNVRESDSNISYGNSCFIDAQSQLQSASISRDGTANDVRMIDISFGQARQHSAALNSQFISQPCSQQLQPVKQKSTRKRKNVTTATTSELQQLKSVVSNSTTSMRPQFLNSMQNLADIPCGSIADPSQAVNTQRQMMNLPADVPVVSASQSFRQSVSSNLFPHQHSARAWYQEQYRPTQYNQQQVYGHGIITQPHQLYYPSLQQHHIEPGMLQSQYYQNYQHRYPNSPFVQQQYYMERQNPGYYGYASQSNQLQAVQQTRQPLIQQQMRVQQYNEWQHHHYPQQPQYPSGVQEEMQAQHVAQGAYEAPNKNTETSQQVVNLQQRLQYVRRGVSEDFHPSLQRLPEQAYQDRKQDPELSFVRTLTSSESRTSAKSVVPKIQSVGVHQYYPSAEQRWQPGGSRITGEWEPHVENSAYLNNSAHSEPVLSTTSRNLSGSFNNAYDSRLMHLLNNNTRSNERSNNPSSIRRDEGQNSSYLLPSNNILRMEDSLMQSVRVSSAVDIVGSASYFAPSNCEHTNSNYVEQRNPGCSTSSTHAECAPICNESSSLCSNNQLVSTSVSVPISISTDSSSNNLSIKEISKENLKNCVNDSAEKFSQGSESKESVSVKNKPKTMLGKQLCSEPRPDTKSELDTCSAVELDFHSSRSVKAIVEAVAEAPSESAEKCVIDNETLNVLGGKSELSGAESGEKEEVQSCKSGVLRLSARDRIVRDGNVKTSRKLRSSKRIIASKHKQSFDVDASEDVEDEEFLPDSSNRCRRSARRENRKRLVDLDTALKESFEKRRPVRNSTVNNYDLQAKWDAIDEEIGDIDCIGATKQEELGDFLIDKIIGVKRSNCGVDKYLVKYRNKSYMHCEWKSQTELEEGDKRSIAKIKRFLRKRCDDTRQAQQEDQEYFNSDFVIVERVLSISGDGDDDSEKKVLVKWRSLPYDEATWENIDVIPSEKIDMYKKHLKIDPLKVKPKQRPTASEWRKIPEGLVFKDLNALRDYQVEGVNWLLYCYFNKQNCILADEMGLGKTVQTICFLQRLYDYGLHGPFLIVVPLSTIHNWQREFEIWTGINAVVYHGSAASRQLIYKTEFFFLHREHKSKKKVVKFDALITTFEMIVSDCDVLKNVNYRVCVIDEAHRLKNRNCKLLTGGLLSFSFEHRVLLTGTPLQNNIDELYSLLNFLEPEKFENSSAFIEQFGACENEDQVSELQQILRPMMLRRLKEDVEKSLQPKEETIIEVQLSNTQKKYYRAILERNFSHLCKGASIPSLMNTMMELRKCCNHPFLINGAEDQVLSEMRCNQPGLSEDVLYQSALVQCSGKLVLISKLLPKLRANGHKVLIFSQMVKVLDIIEEYLTIQKYAFERIDGNVRGDLRQSAIDRFSKKDSDRFVFLLCTRAGGLGINLTAADTVIIFDSDWNPQNDLQAQARCHRIGQTKMVKVYRLITCNTYEREMFNKASLKLGLDKAVLQSTTALKENSLSRKEVEELLKKGAYGAVMDENNEASKFNEEDIETILLRRTTTITVEAGMKGSTFAKASFNSSSNREDIDIDDPNFWSKWAKKANIDIVSQQAEPNLIVLEPRNRKKRFEENLYRSGGVDESGDESDDSVKRLRRSERRVDRKKRSEDDEYRPDEFSVNKSDYFRVERLLGQFGWNRWKIMKESLDSKDRLNEADIEHIARTLLLHCIRKFRGDEKIRELVWQLIIPKHGLTEDHPIKKQDLPSLFHHGWAALPEFNPPAFAVDLSFQRHVHRHSNKLLIRVHQMHILNSEIIGNRSEAIMKGASASEIDLVIKIKDSFVSGWDSECDNSFLIGIHKHGFDSYEMMKEDSLLCFKERFIDSFPSPVELFARFRKLLTYFQRKRNSSVISHVWSKKDEKEFMRILKSYGVKGDATTLINWSRFRQLSHSFVKKTDEDLMEQLYCVLPMCTKQLGKELTAIDQQRAMKVEAISAPRAQKLMQRMNFMKQIHELSEKIDHIVSLFELCTYETMPDGWNSAHDLQLFHIIDENGIDYVARNVSKDPAFSDIKVPEEKCLLRRIIDLFSLLRVGKWIGKGSTDFLEDSDGDSEGPESTVYSSNPVKRKRQKVSVSKLKIMDTNNEKARSFAYNPFLQKLEQFPLSAMAIANTAAVLPHLISDKSISQQALSNLLGITNPPAHTASSTVAICSDNPQRALNLSMKDSDAVEQIKSSDSTHPNILSHFNVTDLLAIANLPPDVRVPVINVETGITLSDDDAPKVVNLGQWLSAHPKYVLDISRMQTLAIKNVKSALSVGETTAKDESSGVVIKTSSSDHEVVGSSLTDAFNVSNKHASNAASQDLPFSIKWNPFFLPFMSDQLVAVYNKSTGVILQPEKWPAFKDLSTWLEKHPQYDVHSSSAPLAPAFTSGVNIDCFGGEPMSASTSGGSMDTLHAQMMLQQSLMNQTFLGLGSCGPLGPYAALLAAANSAVASSSHTPSPVHSAKESTKGSPTPVKINMNKRVAPTVQSLHTIDSSIAKNFSLSSTRSSPNSTDTNTVPKPILPKKTAKGRLNAVVEKLTSIQS